MKFGPLILAAALAALASACGSRPAGNQTAPDNAMPAPAAPMVNDAADLNVAAPDNAIDGVRQPEQPTPGAQVPTTDRQRAQPPRKAEPAPRTAEPADPHSGHDMGNMTHNQS